MVIETVFESPAGVVAAAGVVVAARTDCPCEVPQV